MKLEEKLVIDVTFTHIWCWTDGHQSGLSWLILLLAQGGKLLAGFWEKGCCRQLPQSEVSDLFTFKKLESLFYRLVLLNIFCQFGDTLCHFDKLLYLIRKSFLEVPCSYAYLGTVDATCSKQLRVKRFSARCFNTLICFIVVTIRLPWTYFVGMIF